MGTYSSQTGATAATTCETCPAGKTTVQTGAHNISACQDSRVIYARESENNAINVEDMVCMLCNSTQFCADGLAHPCPAHSVSGDSPATVDDCVCEPGYLRESDTCAEGPPPYWYAGGVQYSCRTLSRTISALAGSARACVCVEGTAGAGWHSNCTECAVGTFNEGLNATGCELCAPGSSNEATRSRNQSDCRCGVGSGNEGNVGPPGGPCECDAGWEAEAGDCSLCEAGSVKPTRGNYECTGCDIEGKYMPDRGGTACLACGDHSTQFEALRCRCDAGYTGDPKDPQALAPNCTMCPADYFKEGPGQHACEPCEDNAWSPPGTSAQNQCLCNVGYEQKSPLDECTACEAGKYKDFNTDDESTGSCKACPEHANSPSTSVSRDACVCNVGFEGPDGEVCTACAAGTFWQAILGGSECENCPAGKYQPNASATACESCYASADSPNASTSIDNCTCNAGYVYVESLLGCSGCAAGKYETGGGCQTCAEGTFTAAPAMTACESCPATVSTHNTNYEDGVNHTHCVCALGYYCRDGPACQNGDCVACPVDTYQPELGDDPTCKECPVNSQSQNTSDESSDCQCNHGYHVTPDELPETCTACAPGTYSDQLHVSACSPCADDTIAASAAQTACVRCHDNAGTYDDQREVCTCDPGHYLQEGSCSPCPVDRYKNASGDQACTACPDHSASPEGSVEREECKCIPGYGEVSSGVCEQCAPNFFKETTANEPCTSCGTDLFIPTPGSRNQTDCVCAPGDTLVGDQCRNCTGHTFKIEYGNESCSPCQDHAETVTSTPTQYSDCKCLPGFASEPMLEQSPVAVDCNDKHGRFLCFDHSTTSLHWFASKHMWNTYDVCNSETSNTPCRWETPDCDMQLDAFDGFLSCPALIIRIWYENSNSGNYRLVRVNNPSEHLLTIQEKMLPGRYTSTRTGIDCRFSGKSETFIKPKVDGNVCTDLTEECLLYCENLCDTIEDCVAFTYDISSVVCHLRRGAPTSAFVSDNRLCFYKPDRDYRWLVDASDKNITVSTIWNMDPAEFTPPGTCTECAAGKAKGTTENTDCTPCAVDTFTDSTGEATCAACPPRSSTHGKTGQALCECVLGHERRWEDSSACEACREGTFKTASDVANRNCSRCGACSSNEYVAQTQHVCNATQDVICTACAANSWLEAGQQSPKPCFCNAGYESSSESMPYSSLCVACNSGSFRGEDSNNSVPCAFCPVGTFTGVVASKSCAPHTPNCIATPGTYVHAEGNRVQDIQCEPCTTCTEGHYANRTCGVHYRNNRADTDCVICETGYYCTNQSRFQCPDNTQSQPGSDRESNCTCKPGFYALGGVCTICNPDYFCTDEVRRACPEHSITLHAGSSHVLDCNCRRGYYRLNVTEFAFECRVCSQDDWCFNNSANNCSDDRMETDDNAWHPGNCTCVEGWYNTDFSADAVAGRCEICPANAYCVGGHLHNCESNEWTNNLIGSTDEEACLCVPGRFLDGATCKLCPYNFFCTGDDSLTACHSHSVTLQEGSTSVDQCLCIAGYEPAANTSCTQCGGETDHQQNGLWKSDTGNVPCQPCKQCWVNQSSQFLYQACSATRNAVCDACDDCLRDDAFAGIFTQHQCLDRIDAVCANCTVCGDEFFEQAACTENADTDCQPIITDANCLVGQYRGNHSARRQSSCLPCRLGEPSAHYMFSSTGRIYNDERSCDVQCLGLSVRRDIRDYSAGCKTCETGNVLLKHITVARDDSDNQVNCSFTCRAGYVRTADDCVLASVVGGRHALALEVVQFHKTSDGFRYDVHHSNHSRFVVVVGPTAPAGCTIRECCWGGLWRVSTLHQMGLVGGENCSAGGRSVTPAELPSERLSPSTLRFEVREEDLGAVANCSEALGVRECALEVSVVDVVHRRVKSQTVRLQLQRSKAHVVHVRGNHTYVPLSMFAVEVQPFVAREATMVFLIVTRVRSIVNMTISLRVREMDAVSLTDDEESRCARFGGVIGYIDGPAAPDGSVALVAGETRVLRSYWVGSPGTLHALYTLEQFSDATPDIMDVAAVRNTTGQIPACQAAPSDEVVVMGTVSAAVGLGTAAVASMAPLVYDSTSTAETVDPLSSPGELGHLLSLWAVAVDDAVRTVTLRGLLAVYVRGNAALDFQNALIQRQSATQLVNGQMDFTRAFRQWCNLRPHECVYEYLRPWNLADNVYELHCPDAGPDASAAAWIRESFGAVHDAGHVAALCQLQQRESRASLLVLVHSMRFMLRATGGWGRDVVFGGQQSESIFWPLVGFETSGR